MLIIHYPKSRWTYKHIFNLSPIQYEIWTYLITCGQMNFEYTLSILKVVLAFKKLVCRIKLDNENVGPLANA